MNIFDLLFGKKKTVNDAILGIIESGRIKGENQVKLYSWYASYSMPNTPEKSSVIMEGNYKEPSPLQLNEIKKILKNLDMLWIKIDEKLNKESKTLSFAEREAFKNWKSIFYLGAIHPIEHNTNPNFELCFDTIDSKSNGYMIFNYSNGELKEMEISASK